MAHINWLTVVLLIVSNLFMLFAWYGHLNGPLKFLSNAPIWLIILVSWGIAIFEYCLMIPANRIGRESGMTLEQLKIVQEAVALLTFVPFSIFVMRQDVSWNYAAAAVCIFAAVFFVFRA